MPGNNNKRVSAIGCIAFFFGGRSGPFRCFLFAKSVAADKWCVSPNEIAHDSNHFHRCDMDLHFIAFVLSAQIRYAAVRLCMCACVCLFYRKYAKHTLHRRCVHFTNAARAVPCFPAAERISRDVFPNELSSLRSRRFRCHSAWPRCDCYFRSICIA